MNQTLPPGAGAQALDALEGQRRLLCAALAAAVKEAIPGAVLGSCGTTDSGFYHDFLLPAPFGCDRLEGIEARMRRLLESPVEIVRLSASEALRLARDEPLLREELERGRFVDETLVRIGERGLLMREAPAPSLAEGFAYRLRGCGGACWRGDESRPMLTRISGEAFASAEELAAHERRAAAAARQAREVDERALRAAI